MALNDGTPTMTMPVAPTGGSYGGGFGGFGDGGWWIILFILVLFGGWGNGWGGNSGNGVQNGYVLTSDFSNLERKMDIIQGDACTAAAAAQATMANGFASTVSAVREVGANAELSRANQTSALMGQMYTMSMADLQRGCDTQAAINTGFASTNYNMATQGAALQTSLATASRDIIDAQNAGTRAVLDAMTAQRIEDKNAQIADLTSQLQAARLAASQAAQTNQLIDTLRPAPIPAYQTVNPWANNGCGCYTCGMSA